MSPKRLLGFVLINVVVSLVVSLSVLALWDRRAPPRSGLPAVVGSVAPGETPGAEATAGTPEATVAPAGTIYVVKAGDTLSIIAQQYGVTIEDLVAVNQLADPNLLRVGQTLIIPVSGAAQTAVAAATATANAPPTPIPTATPSGARPAVTLRGVTGRGDLANEAIVLINEGGRVDLANWTLSDKQGNRFIFPSLVLLQGAQVQVHTAAGTNSATDLYWGRPAAVWGDRGDEATLTDAAGAVVDTLQLP